MLLLFFVSFAAFRFMLIDCFFSVDAWDRLVGKRT